MTEEVQSARPGAGLPRLEGLVLRYILFPFGDAVLSWEQAKALFLAEGERILCLADRIDNGLFSKQILIHRLRGIEDSSRYCSIEMVMEHLMITGSMMCGIIQDLLASRTPSVKVDTANLKPKGGRGQARKEDFHEFLQQFHSDLPDFKPDRQSGLRHYYPWLGDLTAKQWLTLAAMHQRLHRRQAESIASRL
jgi:hypothetical protein